MRRPRGSRFTSFSRGGGLASATAWDLPAGRLDLGGQRRRGGYDVFLPQVRGHARDRLDQPAGVDPVEELVVKVQAQFLIVRCRPAWVVGVSEPGDDPSQL